MINDPIVEEVRNTAKKIMKRFNNNSKKYFEHLRDIEETYNIKAIRRHLSYDSRSSRKRLGTS